MKRQWLVVCLLAFGMIVGVTKLALSFTDGHDSKAVSQPEAVWTAGDASEAKTFMGRIVQMEGKYVLQESASKSTFQLDDQDKAKQFDGQSVKVTGTLDSATNTIHVTDIQNT